MKSILSFGLLISIICTFLNCDGRDRLKDHKKTSLAAFNQQKSSNTNITYIPESYSEKVTDTIFSNGYHVYIKQYTVKDRSIKVEKKDQINVFKDTNTDIKVSLNNEIIFDKSFSIKDTIITEHLSRLELENFYLRNVWTEKLDKYYPDVPCILMDFFNPKTMFSTTVMITPLKDEFIFVEL